MNKNCMENNTREKVRSFMKVQRLKAEKETYRDSSNIRDVIFIEKRKGYYNNEYVNRLVLFLKGTGCTLAKETGGCTFCGFYNATNFGEKINGDAYIEQVFKVIENKNTKFEQYPIICLYNDGSILREDEISFRAFLSILEILHTKETLKKVVIESRVEDITEEKVKEIRMVTNKEIEIAVGFESANNAVRDLCINKSFENNVFEDKLKICEKYNINIIPLMILKPPFLSEKDAVYDYINSLKYLENFKLERIDMELPTVEKHTLVYELWRNELYRPAWLWSVIEVLKAKSEMNLKTKLYISPSNYTVDSYANSSNCTKCDDIISKAFDKYNETNDFSIFKHINCSCKEEWLQQYESETFIENLSEHIEHVLKKI